MVLYGFVIVIVAGKAKYSFFWCRKLELEPLAVDVVVFVVVVVIENMFVSSNHTYLFRPSSAPTPPIGIYFFVVVIFIVVFGSFKCSSHTVNETIQVH